MTTLASPTGWRDSPVSDPIRDLVLSAASISTEADAEAAVDLWNALTVQKKRLREAEGVVKGAITDYLHEHGSVEIAPDRKLVLSPKKKTTCRDVEATLEALLDAVGGSLTELVEHLAAQPIKYGKCREALGEAWDQHFEVEVSDDVKERQIKVLDARYAKL